MKRMGPSASLERLGGMPYVLCEKERSILSKIENAEFLFPI